MEATASVGIDSGPSKWDLMLSLFEGRIVTFSNVGNVGMSFPVLVTGLGSKVERGSAYREDWVVTGIVVPDSCRPSASPQLFLHDSVTCEFSTLTRSGRISLV